MTVRLVCPSSQMLREEWNRADVAVHTDCSAVDFMVTVTKFAADAGDAAAKSMKAGADFDTGVFWIPEKDGGRGGLQAAVQVCFVGGRGLLGGLLLEVWGVLLLLIATPCPPALGLFDHVLSKGRPLD
jgi:hypothetical protein